jgi:CRISPR-associated protein Csh1
MLSTLISIGKEIAQQQGEWDNLVEIPKKVSEIDNNGNTIQNHVLEIVFDVDNKKFVFEDRLRAFGKENSPTRYRNIKSEKWGRNGDPWMVTCSYPDKIEILQKSIFGKKGEDIGCGLFQNAISKKQSEIKESLLYKALEFCYSLKDVQVEGGKKGIDVLSSDYISLKMKGKLSRVQKITLISIALKSEKLGISQPKLLCELDGYDKFVLNQCSKSKSKISNEDKLCYATGGLMSNIILPEFSDREDLNNLFVATTINYANNFQKSALSKNYQIGKETKDLLETGSNYIRNQFKNKPLYVAGVRHFIIPTFLSYDVVDLKFELDHIQKMSEWLFSFNELANLFEGIKDEANGKIFWINYIAFDSDGNSVKVINQIKDVSSVWFLNIVKANDQQSELISSYFKQKRLNLSSIYNAIPIRVEHEKKNDALKLLSQILEQRKVQRSKVFRHFTELILCHYYNRYRSYLNINFKPDSFDIAIRDSVIKYLFLISLLKSLKLIDMEENEKPLMESVESTDKLQQFFSDMGYSPQQQAMYWLGRIVWYIGNAQKTKEHKQMPVLNKINYDGMDYSNIQRLLVDCFKLATQYRVVDKIDFFSKQFNQYFPAKEEFWQLSKQEAVFFILSGFSLYINNN